VRGRREIKREWGERRGRIRAWGEERERERERDLYPFAGASRGAKGERGVGLKLKQTDATHAPLRALRTINGAVSIVVFFAASCQELA
jgi:hypothetical protein